MKTTPSHSPVAWIPAFAGMTCMLCFHTKRRYNVITLSHYYSVLLKVARIIVDTGPMIQLVSRVRHFHFETYWSSNKESCLLLLGSPIASTVDHFISAMRTPAIAESAIRSAGFALIEANKVKADYTA